MFYIATDMHGRGIRFVTAFDKRADLWGYAVLFEASSYGAPKRADSIPTLCDKLCDKGPGIGSRSHHRVNRADAKRLISNGANPIHCWNLDLPCTNGEPKP
jgi:hypothetical protein